MRKNYGVILIGLVLTISILLILSEVVLFNLNNEIIDKVMNAHMMTTMAVQNEKDEINFIENYDFDNYSEVILKNYVKIGDYVEYPFEYYDIYTGKYYSSSNGWRVIDIDDSGSIKIISTGIPVEWYYEVGDNNIKHNFELLTNLNMYNKELITGKNFKIDGIADKIENLSLADLNNFCNKIYGANREENDTSKLIDSYELFYLPNEFTYYWLSTNDVDDNEKIYYVSHNAIESEKDYRLGIRPVITLKDNWMGIYVNDVWKYIN